MDTTILAFTNGAGTRIAVTASGEWTGIDMENLYEILGLHLREGCFDPSFKKKPAKEQTP